MKKQNRLNYFYEAWMYLSEECDKRDTTLSYCLDIGVVKVNPVTCRVDDNDMKNTENEVWLEFGFPEYIKEIKSTEPTHDIDLDCGAPTFEEAIVKLAKLVYKKFSPLTDKKE